MLHWDLDLLSTTLCSFLSHADVLFFPNPEHGCVHPGFVFWVCCHVAFPAEDLTVIWVKTGHGIAEEPPEALILCCFKERGEIQTSSLVLVSKEGQLDRCLKEAVIPLFLHAVQVNKDTELSRRYFKLHSLSKFPVLALI